VKPGAPEGALRTATIKCGQGARLDDACTHHFCLRATKPDHWLSATRIKLRGKAKAHKPADSGGSVVRCARRC